MNRLGSASIFLLLWGLLSCQTDPAPTSRKDWADMTFYATGVGFVGGDRSPSERIRAIQAAKRDAARQLEEKILMHRTDSGKTLSEQVQKEEQRKKLSAFVRGAEVTSVEYQADGVHVHTRLSLGNHLKATLGLLPLKEIRSSEPHSMESY